jgi:hypothetical protein
MPPARFAALFGLLCALAAAPFAGAGPVAFEFVPTAASAIKNPYARELWAEVLTPAGDTLVLPAYYAGHDAFAVHARPDQVGAYKLGKIVETTAGKPAAELAVRHTSPAVVENQAPPRLPFIQRDPHNPAAFLRSDLRPFSPVGANLAWAPVDRAEYYCRAIPAFARANLNWMRVWMVHWSGLNLDWLPADMGPSPKPGGLDPRVAENWDQLLATAEASGVYLQVVFQHHGQFTTGANSEWAANPWNAANPGGFLHTPAEFFTSPEARIMTMLKYRYIVARWGWSPAVFAWELFNEVHWVDAIDKDKDVAAVAHWHDAMAAFIRSVDVYHHLITTSTENLASPIYASMDFYQPHLYAANLLAGARSYATPAPALDRPAFYGEFGDDHLPVSPEVKQSGLTTMPTVWSSIMGRGGLAAQPWDGASLLAQNRLGEIGAVFRFLALNRIPARTGLEPFSTVVESSLRSPLRLAAGQIWQRRAAPEFTFPLDGREPLEVADVPGILVGSPASLADGFPGRSTYHVSLPQSVTAHAAVRETGTAGAALRVSVDGQVAAEQRWTPGAKMPATLSFSLSAGEHTVVVENPGGPDWVRVDALDFGLDVSVLAAVGRRNDTFIAAWLWHRANLYAVTPGPAVAGTLILEAVPAGTWTVTWWDTATGTAAAPTVLDHPGGPLRLTTPPILRHVAVALTRR